MSIETTPASSPEDRWDRILETVLGHAARDGAQGRPPRSTQRRMSAQGARARTSTSPFRDSQSPRRASHELAAEGAVADGLAARDELMAPPELLDYNADESLYGAHVREMLLELLKGDRNELELLARYHREAGRIGALPCPKTVDPQGLRLAKVEGMLVNALRFLHDGSVGGPVLRSEDRAAGTISQTRDFATRFPHIVLRRTDTFDAATGEAIRSKWCAHRVQNQKNSTQRDQLLDIAGLGIEILKFAL